MASHAAAASISQAGASSVRMDGTSWAMLLVLSLVWGGSFIFVEIVLTAAPVLTLVAFRVALAAVVLWLVIVLAGIPLPRSPGTWAAFAIMGFFNNALPFSLIAWGQTEITAGLAAILNATTPLFAALVAGAVLVDERLTGRKISGLLLGFVGVAVMIGPAALFAVGENAVHQLAVVGAALSYGLAAVFGRRFARLGVAPLTVSAGQLTGSSLVIVPAALLLEGPASFAVSSPGVWVAILVNAVFSTAFAYILYFRILARAGATNVTLVTVLVPVVAVIVGVIALGEQLDGLQIAGMLLIFAGLAVIDGRLFARLATRRSRSS